MEKLSAVVPWEVFRKPLAKALKRSDGAKGGRPPCDAVLMFKIMVLQALYNLSDDQAEFQIQYRLSFMRFLGLGLGDRVPDAKTIWLFREHLTQLATVSAKSPLAAAIRYALTRMVRLRPYLEHGVLELDNNAAERAMRTVALGRKNYLFVGSPSGGRAAAIAYTLIETAKLNGVDPQAWLANTLARIPDYKITRIEDLLPWRHRA